MEFSTATLGALLILAIAIAAAALVVAVVALQGQRRVRAAYAKFSQGSREDVLALLERHIDEVGRLRTEVGRQRAFSDHLRGLIGRTVSRVGTVRYDAFDDMGGRLSFSIALLDEHGDGAIITAMNGRVQTRTYAKPVVRTSSPHNLSEEEVEAIRLAMAAPLVPIPAAARMPAPTPSEPPDAAAGDVEAGAPVAAVAGRRAPAPRSRRPRRARPARRPVAAQARPPTDAPPPPDDEPAV